MIRLGMGVRIASIGSLLQNYFRSVGCGASAERFGDSGAGLDGSAGGFLPLGAAGCRRRKARRRHAGTPRRAVPSFGAAEAAFLRFGAGAGR